jgi:iron(III) transport system ATP-binding protein
VMREGVIEQIGNPHQLYTQPATRFVADFIGSANFLPGTWDGAQIDLLGYRRPHAQDFPRGPVTVMVRPEAVEFAPDGETGLEATYMSSSYLGPMTEFVFDVAGQELFATMTGGGRSDAKRGDVVHLRLKEAGVSLLPAR